MQGEENRDNEILKDFRDGDQERAFRMLVQCYQQRLYGQCRRMLNNHEDADDALQNTLVKAWKGLNNFREDSKLYSWLYRIAVNECLTLIEKQKKHRTFSIDEAREPVATNSSGPDAEEIHRALIKAVSQLPEKQQLVFSLKYFDELKYEEISAMTGTSVGALKSSFHIAVKKIEQSLRERSNLLESSKS